MEKPEGDTDQGSKIKVKESSDTSESDPLLFPPQWRNYEDYRLLQTNRQGLISYNRVVGIRFR